MADQNVVVASEDIYAENNCKLIAKDTVIKSGLKARLLGHKLLKPIDQSLMVKNGVTAEFLASEAARITEQDPRLRKLIGDLGDQTKLFQQIANLPLFPQMAFKITVAREQQPRLFNHLLVVTLIAQYLALSKALPEKDRVGLLYAGLFHDFGELHVDPTVQKSKHKLTDLEWHHIYAHPITGFMIAQETLGLDEDVAIAILQHQERLDGSGYPFGLRGAKISSFARIIGVADACASILERDDDSEHLSNMMRLNQKKFDPKLLDFLYTGFGRQTIETSNGNMVSLPQLKSVALLLEKWDKFITALANEGVASPPAGLEYLFERMVNLRSMLLQVGFDPDSVLQLVELAAGDLEIAKELFEVLSEISWHIKDLERETIRREKTHPTALSFYEKSHLNEWHQGLHACLEQFEVRQ